MHLYLTPRWGVRPFTVMELVRYKNTEANLIGSIVPGPKVPALTNNRILYRDGVAVAALVAGETQWLQELEPREMREAESALVKRQAGSPLLAYLR